MRKAISIFAVVALFASTTSCKKDYTCTCVTTSAGQDDEISVYEMPKQKEDDAKAACEALVFGDPSTTCSL